jgi:tRNA threonylcarbamoyladenosine biosynthesis protein TsaB
MKILAIECTHQLTAVAVENEGRITENLNNDWKKTAETIIPLISKTLDEAELTLQDLDCIAISSGPGTFTALRIGMSAAKGIAYGAGKILVPVPTLKAMASAALVHTAGDAVVPVIPTGTGEYYYSIYVRDTLVNGGDGPEVLRSPAGKLADRLEQLGGSFTVVGRRHGNTEIHAGPLHEKCIDADFFTAASIVPLAEITFARRMAVDPSGVEPEYNQMFVPGIKKH